ncbi:hypothetical protein L596_011127 [Steinernema carpocapsae]|uniref:Uncharacterized protein n=1 Tax=Steinernema carpocapsae TaxID=34508 RepID=A0A4U5NTF1_STECR|nr:hypothetical protein L596_011127 [Steinernema carpocapsae]
MTSSVNSLIYIFLISLVVFLASLLACTLVCLMWRVLRRKRQSHSIKFVPGIETETVDMETRDRERNPSWLNEGFYLCSETRLRRRSRHCPATNLRSCPRSNVPYSRWTKPRRAPSRSITS